MNRNNRTAKIERTALEAYEEHQAKISQLLSKIQAGLLEHDRGCTKGHDWGHVGELTDIESQLSEIADRLLRQGEYAPEGIAKYDSFDYNGNPIKVTIPRR